MDKKVELSTQEKNEVIAKWMGVRAYSFTNMSGQTAWNCGLSQNYGSEESAFKAWCQNNCYHLSWDLLMPVVEKIKSMGGGASYVHLHIGTSKNDHCSGSWDVHLSATLMLWQDIFDGNGHRFKTLEYKSEWLWRQPDLMKALYKTVYDFIVWWNAQDKGTWTEHTDISRS